MHAHIVVESAIVPTPRLTQAAGLFDLALPPTLAPRMGRDAAAGTATVVHRPHHRAVRLRQVDHRSHPVARE